MLHLRWPVSSLRCATFRLALLDDTLRMSSGHTTLALGKSTFVMPATSPSNLSSKAKQRTHVDHAEQSRLLNLIPAALHSTGRVPRHSRQAKS